MEYLVGSDVLKQHDIDAVLVAFFDDYSVGCVVDYTTDDFDKTKCMLFEDKVVALVVGGDSVCIANLYTNKVGNCLSIFTPKQHRGKGYAMNLATWLLNNGMFDTWTVSFRNDASIKLAKQLGLTQVTDIKQAGTLIFRKPQINK